MEQLEPKDMWRIRNTEKEKIYLETHNKNTIRCRLDYFDITGNAGCSIINTYTSDNIMRSLTNSDDNNVS